MQASNWKQSTNILFQNQGIQPKRQPNLESKCRYSSVADEGQCTTPTDRFHHLQDRLSPLSGVELRRPH